MGTDGIVNLLNTHTGCQSWGMNTLSATTKGERHYLWRAVGQEGNVLDILVQRRRDKKATKKFFHQLLKGLLYVPRRYIAESAKEGRVDERHLAEIMTRVMPYLTLPEQRVYLCLYYESNGLITRMRYEDLARQCHLSLSAVQRVVKTLRSRKLLQTDWRYSRGTYTCRTGNMPQRRRSSFPP